MRLLFLFFLTCLLVYGRDNPFFPADPNEKQMSTTNRPETLKPFTTQQISLPNSARAVKAVIIRYQNLDGSISNEELQLNNQIDWHQPFIISQEKTPDAAKTKEQAKSKTIKSKYITFVPSERSIKLITKDKMLRNFMLTSPYRIVMDFSRDTSFKPQTYAVNEPPFKSVRIGNHDKYYRVVIELDGQYRYTLQTSADDYTFVCK